MEGTDRNSLMPLSKVDEYQGSYPAVGGGVWLKKPGHEFNHSPPFSAEVKNEWSYTSSPSTRLHGLKQGNLYLDYLK